MLFFLTRELWQTVRHTRKAATRSDIWYWTPDDFEDDVLLHSPDETKTLSSIVGGAAETARDPVSIVAASAELTEEFKQVILALIRHPGKLRISLMLTSLLDEFQVEQFREFLQENRDLQTKVSTFFFATRLDTEMTPLEPAFVSEEYRSFLRLLCVGREALADALGLFRVPLVGEPEEPDELSLDSESPFQKTGILAVLGVQSWLPRREEIVKLTEGLLSMHVVAEEKKAAISSRIRGAEPDVLITGALYLGMSDEPLNSRHFSGLIPPPPDSPFETWKVPFSAKRARKQTHYLQRTVQQDFSEYTSSLEATLDEISGRIRRQSAVCFSEAAKVYRAEMLKDANLGTLAILLRDYYPAFGEYEEAMLADVEEEPTGWPPDESLDLFCGVYEVLDEGLDQLPTTKVWSASIYITLAFFLAAGVLWDPESMLSPILAAVGLLAPAGVWVYRMFSIRKMRKQLVEISEDVFASLRETFTSEIEWILRQTRVKLERDIRTDALALGERLRQEFDSIPFLFSSPDVDPDEIQQEIRGLRSALIGNGIDELKLEPLPTRLEGLARKITERVRRDVTPTAETSPEPTPCEMVEEWIDELVGSSILPLEKVALLRNEMLQVASTWRLPPLMAPLTDAELHRGYRKVVVLSDSDIAYQRLYEALPNSSGNPVVTLKAWTGPAPGVAACSVVTGLPNSILDHQTKRQDAVRPPTERSMGIR